ncbi:hypothetical protein BDN71DRAFT_1509062 [Pleurotus eryngii]|uniref:Uncharacterized protein n=1 Tax=Pleurotus eryngii TaxID=5323 RepID=A0A9P5ZRJ7_PLEER|nr:hypothetical protein BDN71DRAFT_1509062 [Pleurotus eryngii]
MSDVAFVATYGGPAFYSQQPQAQPQMVYVQKPPEKETSSCCLPFALLVALGSAVAHAGVVKSQSVAAICK